MGTNLGGDTSNIAALWQVLREVCSASGGGRCDEELDANAWGAEDARAIVAAALVAGQSRARCLSQTETALRAALDSIRRDFLDRVGRLADAPPLGDVLAVLRRFDDVAEDLVSACRGGHARYENGTGHASEPLTYVVELAHDMRSPLTSILFLVETLRQQHRRTQSNAVAARQLAIVYSAAFSLSSLVSDVVDLAKNGARLLERKPIPLSIADMMRSVQEMVQPIAEEKKLRLRFVQTAADVRLGQPLALCRVLLNLTTNALKFTTQGEVTITASQLDDSRVLFEVRDTGRGIAPSDLESILDRRLIRDTGDARRPGLSRTRLGLAMCDALVQNMGSRLEVHSALGEGTCFSFVLEMPVAPADATDESNGYRMAERQPTA